jgi:chromosome segregation ATPase
MTETEFSRQMSELSALAAELNRETDSLNNMLAKFEEQIRALNVGLEAGVLLTNDPNDNGELQWIRIAVPGETNPWRLYIWKSKGGMKPALECSRDERIQALEALPRLLEKLKQEAKARLDVIQEAKKFVREPLKGAFLRAIDELSPKSK